ncbi:hypothetical protein TCDM_10880 [Trypanosoma cruzi Dm28c]|uniref:Uncharacterized protein n=1 Tax=Trypanosoma cruzi Dm28c TaxID=1416333 RepID=V5D270_TRYCR|nr:hypothetical protein TCDM_10880 [Trypanosoma cruzi Dm28c]
MKKHGGGPQSRGNPNPNQLQSPIGSQPSDWWSRRCRAVRVSTENCNDEERGKRRSAVLVHLSWSWQQRHHLARLPAAKTVAFSRGCCLPPQTGVPLHQSRRSSTPPTQRGSNSGRCGTCDEHAAAMTKQNRGAQSTLSKSSAVTLFRMRDGEMPTETSVSFLPLVRTQQKNNSQAHNNAGKHTHTHTHTNRRGAVGARTRRMRRPTADTPSRSAHTAKQHPQNKCKRRKHPPRMEDEKRHSAITASSSTPRSTGYGHSPQPTHSAHEVSSQRATQGSGALIHQ